MRKEETFDLELPSPNKSVNFLEIEDDEEEKRTWYEANQITQIDQYENENKSLSYRIAYFFFFLNAILSFLVIPLLGYQAAKELNAPTWLRWLSAFSVSIVTIAFGAPPAAHTGAELIQGKKPDLISWLELPFNIFSGIGYVYLFSHYAVFKDIAWEYDNPFLRTCALFLMFMANYWPFLCLLPGFSSPVLCNWKFSREFFINKLTLPKYFPLHSLFLNSEKKHKLIYTAKMRNFIWYILITLQLNIYHQKNTLNGEMYFVIKDIENALSLLNKDGSNSAKVIKKIIKIYQDCFQRNNALIDFHDDSWFKFLLICSGKIFGIISARFAMGTCYHGGLALGTILASLMHVNKNTIGQVFARMGVSGALPQAAINEETMTKIIRESSDQVLISYKKLLLYYKQGECFNCCSDLASLISYKNAKKVPVFLFIQMLSFMQSMINSFLEKKYGTGSDIWAGIVFAGTFAQANYGFNQVFAKHRKGEIILLLDYLHREVLSLLSDNEIIEIAKETNLTETYNTRYGTTIDDLSQEIETLIEKEEDSHQTKCCV